MLAEQKILNAIKMCQQAKDTLHNGNKRLATGELDHAKENVIAAIHLLISEIELEEGKF